jgi:hypothetical protein
MMMEIAEQFLAVCGFCAHYAGELAPSMLLSDEDSVFLRHIFVTPKRAGHTHSRRHDLVEFDLVESLLVENEEECPQ